MLQRNYILLLGILFASTYTSHGQDCQMDSITNWALRETVEIYDTQRGIFYDQATTYIDEISSVSYGEGLNQGPYIEPAHNGSRFTLSTNNAFPNYEEDEIAQSMSLTVIFRCSSGSTRILVLEVNIIDTNNNAPQFLPTNNFEFIVTPPLRPGFEITGCINDIVVRDIDLTTQRIDFQIDENPYFEIDYDASSTNPKEFKAVLRTLTLIRTLSEPIELTISATDVDLTGDPPITSSAAISIQGDSEFQLPEELIFSQPFYLANYTETNEVVLHQPITLEQGYHEEVVFQLEGDAAENFDVIRNGNQIIIAVATPPLSESLLEESQILLVVRASREYTSGATATIVIQIPQDSPTESGVAFNKVLYDGLIQDRIVLHEFIIVSGYEGSDVEILGEYSSLFQATLSDGAVVIQLQGLVTLPVDIPYVALELHVSDARAVLILDYHSVEEEILLPTIEFSSTSYTLRVDTSQTGLVGRVQATADNGEAVTYSFQLDNEHLLQRISVDSEGGLHLSAPADHGEYSFQVVATTIVTRASGTAEVHLTVDTIVTCSEDDLVVPPLIILDIDEEEPHNNLVVLDRTVYDGCQYNLINHWPVEQSWLYVNEEGLHANAIDREHESIAFMTLSQIQVELVLECDRDNQVSRFKRFTKTQRTDNLLDPYDYGNLKWILSDSMSYSPRSSLVNLIVNDINDNYPIFEGKVNEPIAVGYPVVELEERILPRALAELKATDADVGENAALWYWSSEEVLAVSPTTGFIHVREGAVLVDGSLLTVSATDRNGEGLTGTLQLLVRVIDESHIAIVTIRDAFLDDESKILDELSSAVGYEVKILRSTVINNNVEPQTDEVNSRNIRELRSATGTVLQLYVYGLVQREPVGVERLTSDINNNIIETVNVASTISLEDHLESLQICPVLGRDIGLLVATIVLSVLLFILIVIAAVWFFLKWRKKQYYEEFSDNASMASRNESLDLPPKPEGITKPRLNIEDLKRSERRLQEMLGITIEEVTIEPSTSKKPQLVESLDIPKTTFNTQTPVVIQSIDKLKSIDDSDDDDEFGERLASKRKSVVTFNENVERIIHVEDTPEDDNEYTVYKF